MNPKEVADWLDGLSSADGRKASIRKVLSAAGRLASRSRTKSQIIAGPGRPRTIEHDPKAERCWCADCRRNFPSYSHQPSAER